MITSSSWRGSERKNEGREVSATELPADTKDYALRPKTLKEYVGQESIKKPLLTAIAAAKKRGESIGHTLLYGPPGLGKTTLAEIIGHEMNASIRRSSGPAIEKVSDLISLLTTLEPWEVLFIDEIHRLRTVVEEVLYTAMEDFCIDIMVGSGTGATAVKMPLPHFTLIGATTRLSGLTNPLRDRFEHVLKLDFYSQEDLTRIVARSLDMLWVPLSNELCQMVAMRSRGTPRIANRFVRTIRDHGTLGYRLWQSSDLEGIFTQLSVDERGLDALDRSYLEAIGKGQGNPLGLSTLAGILGEDEGTLEDVVEPYLLKIGLIEKTTRGRVLRGPR